MLDVRVCMAVYTRWDGIQIPDLILWKQADVQIAHNKSTLDSARDMLHYMIS